MHFEILEYVVHLPAVLRSLLRIEDDAQRDTSFVGVEERSPGDPFGAADGNASCAFVARYVEARIDLLVRKFNHFLDPDPHRPGPDVREKSGLLGE